MANERAQRLIQESLDGQLSLEQQQELVHRLDTDSEAALEYQRLKQVDRMLAAPPMERAPERLALAIMARLAVSMKPQEMPKTSEAALMLGFSLVLLVLMPMLVAAMWLFLHALGNPNILSVLIDQLMRLLMLLAAMLQVFVQQAEMMVHESPEAHLLLAGLIPVAMLWLLRYALDGDDAEDPGGAD